MRNHFFIVLLLALTVVALPACKRKLKLEGKVTGFKPGSTDTLLLHVVSEKGVSVECESPGYSCKRTDVAFNGETDIEVETIGSGTEKKIYLKGQIGPRISHVVIDPAASMPPAVRVGSTGYVDCVARECSGSLEIAPAGHLQLKAPAGTVVEVGTDKLTVGADGNLDRPVNITPAIKDQLLTKLFGRDPVTFGSTTLSLTFPDKAKATTKFDLTTETAGARIDATLKDITKGPVLFPWEKGTAARGKPSALYCFGSYCNAGGAADATLADLRVVVVTEAKPARTSECSYVSASGVNATANLTMHDLLATAYERGTGKKLGSKLFVADKYCSANVTAKSADTLASQSSYPSFTAIAAWGATMAK
ncbi:MAG: hypothetical protein JWM74_533 [Myxococcaceae bacterium]|jgi:hypothetical protein|nr:hypothetical protein [Myxococcaceae bacterium]